MSLLATVLYGQTPHPLPPRSYVRYHTTKDDDEAPCIIPDGHAYCTCCQGVKLESEMFVKDDGTRAKTCAACTARRRRNRDKYKEQRNETR